MKSMRALVKKKAEEGLWLEEVPVPSIGINDVLIQVLRTGICGTAVHIYNWDAWARRRPPRRRHGRQPVATRTREAAGRDAYRRRSDRDRRRRTDGPGHEGGIRRRVGNERQPDGVPRHALEHVPRRADRDARH